MIARIASGVAVGIFLFLGPGAARGEHVSHEKFIESVAEGIAKLKEAYPQLAGFSREKNVDAGELKISYSFRARRAASGAGWRAGVPKPGPDGLWLYIDLHDPESMAQLHTQPSVKKLGRVDGKDVAFLIREGSATKKVAGAISALLESARKPSAGLHEINGRPATAAEFESLRARLVEVRNWSCKMTSEGGIEQFEAREKNGPWHRVLLAPARKAIETLPQEKP
jgi:hypothetical protein